MVRHAQSEANMSRIWQGRTDGALTPAGLDQIESLQRRCARTEFALIVSSPLGRARATARAIGDPEIEDDLIEIDLGSWEGMGFSELLALAGPEMEALCRGSELRAGGTGETRQEVAGRAWRAVERIFGRLGPGQRALVVTHGGVLEAMSERFLGRNAQRRRVASFVDNTSVTRLVWRFDRVRMASFNDITHLGQRPGLVESALASGRPVLALIRHGRTDANHTGRWQGSIDEGLDQTGFQQARALASWYGPVGRVVSSPLSRARDTARALSGRVEEYSDLAELRFGAWEGMTNTEIRTRFPGLFGDIFERGLDLARGIDGETWAQLERRISAAVLEIDPQGGEVTGIVTHGAAIRAFLTALSGGGWSAAGNLATPENTSVTHVVLGDHGMQVADFSTAPHLESWPRP
jgi:broad specificity phosphatase PhoE